MSGGRSWKEVEAPSPFILDRASNQLSLIYLISSVLHEDLLGAAAGVGGVYLTIRVLRASNLKRINYVLKIKRPGRKSFCVPRGLGSTFYLRLPKMTFEWLLREAKIIRGNQEVPHQRSHRSGRFMWILLPLLLTMAICSWCFLESQVSTCQPATTASLPAKLSEGSCILTWRGELLSSQEV